MNPKPSPAPETIKEVLGSHPELVDGDARFDQADPYVVALALEHARNDYHVTVIANDDGLRTACDSFAIPTLTDAEFVARVFQQARA